MCGSLPHRSPDAYRPQLLRRVTSGLHGWSEILWKRTTSEGAHRSSSLFNHAHPGHWAGLQPGDELIEVNGRDARDGPAFPDLKPEAVYSMVVKRGNDRIEAEMAATAVPAEIPQPVTDGPLRSPAEHGCAKSR